MSQGYFGENHELYFEIELVSAAGIRLPVDALLDTGFTEWLAIDRQDIVGFDWTFLSEQSLRMAKGFAVFDTYAARVRIDGQLFEILAYVGDGLPEVLIGLKWLETRKLVVDISQRILTLGNA